MTEWRKALDSFIDLHEYRNNDDILGVVACGSYLTNNNHKDSDLDVQVITSNNIKDLIRGVEHVDDIKVEYFEKPLIDYYKTADVDFYNQSNALVSIIEYGEVIFDKYKEIKKLQSHIAGKYCHPLPRIKADKAQEMLFEIDRGINSLDYISKNNRILFNHYFHVSLEKIRDFYSRLCGCPQIPNDKVYKIYTDGSYRKAFCKGTIIPETLFIAAYFNACQCKNDINWMLELLNNLYCYSKKDLDIKNLPKHTTKVYSEKPSLSEGDNAKEMVCILHNRVNQLKRMCETNDPLFEHVFHLFLEKIKKFYCSLNNLNGKKLTTPNDILDEKLEALFYDTCDFSKNKEDNINKIEAFFSYCSQGIDVDPENYRIKILSRNV